MDGWAYLATDEDAAARALRRGFAEVKLELMGEWATGGDA